MSKKKGRHEKKRPATPVHGKKNGISGWTKLLVVMLLVVGVVVIWQTSQQAYPTYATGVFYDNPTVSGDGAKIQLPYSFVKDKKIVFLDINLPNKVNELGYQGRVIPLSLYKGGNYLPLIALYTPSGKVIAGVRTCEPCGSFSMHIGEGKYLVCDACGTKWDIETLKGVSGGCPNYPPPKLTSSVNGNIEIDLSPLGIKLI